MVMATRSVHFTYGILSKKAQLGHNVGKVIISTSAKKSPFFRGKYTVLIHYPSPYDEGKYKKTELHGKLAQVVSLLRLNDNPELQHVKSTVFQMLEALRKSVGEKRDDTLKRLSKHD